MDLARIRDYLRRHYAGQDVRVVGWHVVPSYWHWHASTSGHQPMPPRDLVDRDLIHEAFRALSVDGLPKPTLWEAVGVALVCSGEWARCQPVPFEDIQASQ